MKRKIELILVALLVVGGLGAVVLTRGGGPGAGDAAQAEAAADQARETTIRNVTDKTITYKIYPSSRPEALETRTIAPDAIDRFPTDEALSIEYNNGEEEVIYSLDAGKPYSFRYDDETHIEIFLGSHGRADAVDLAPWVPTPDAVVDRMLELAGVTGRDVLFDIGCGDGRIVITAARRYGARGVGIDIDPAMIKESERNAAAAGVERQVKFIGMDATKADISEATVVSLYLLPESNALMRPILEAQLRPKSRVVCHNYEIPGWESKKVLSETVEDENGEAHYIYLYVR